MEKDYSKYCYFVSKAKNFGISLIPDKKKIVDGNVDFIPGLRIEFRNGMLRIEKSEENKSAIDKIRSIVEKEKFLDQKQRTVWEESVPQNMLPEKDVKELLDKKNEEIENLKTELDKKSKKI